MYHGLNRHEWFGRSVLLAHLANLNRGKNTTAFKPADFDIYDSRGQLKTQGRTTPKVPLARVLAGMGIKKEGQKNGPDSQADQSRRP